MKDYSPIAIAASIAFSAAFFLVIATWDKMESTFVTNNSTTSTFAKMYRPVPQGQNGTITFYNSSQALYVEERLDQAEYASLEDNRTFLSGQ